MLKNLIAAGAVAGALAFAIPSTPAQAISGLKAADTNPSGIIDVRRRGRHWGGHRRWGHRHRWRGHRGWRHRGWRHRHHRHHRRWRGARYWGYGWGWGRSCRWLHRRAIVTGSRYWWRRYYRCRGW